MFWCTSRPAAGAAASEIVLGLVSLQQVAVLLHRLGEGDGTGSQCTDLVKVMVRGHSA